MSLPARWSQKIEASDPTDEIMELKIASSVLGKDFEAYK